MSRAYNARRKAKRQARAAAERENSREPSFLRAHPTALVPVLLIAAILVAIALVGTGSSTDGSRTEVREEVSALLADIPQDGRTLGSRQAPITLWMFADLECPTVRRFAEAYLPSILKTWVRDGTMNIEYRSLQTDTFNEKTFFEQEAAALAAGRQDKMWNFLLTFLYQQGQEDTDYVDDEFLSGIASQVPDLILEPWRRDRDDPIFYQQVAAAVHTGTVTGLDSTPSFVIDLADGRAGGGTGSSDVSAVKEEIELSLRREIRALGEENFGDTPTLSPFLGGRAGKSN